MSEQFLSLANAVECFAVEARDGAQLPVYTVGGLSSAPGLMVGHANGLAAGSYEPWLRELCERFRVFAFDARGHGGSSRPEGPLEEVFSVDRFADDLAAIAAAVRVRLGSSPLHFAGHSLAAAAALRLAARGGGLPFSSSTLFEPPIFPPREAPNHAEAIDQQERLIRGSARRQARWASPDALRDYLAVRGVFRTFVPAMLDAHCRATLKPDGAGAYALCCPPEVESAIFAAHRDADTWERLSQIRDRLHFVSGDPSAADRDWVSGAMAAIADRVPAADLVTLPNAGHMMIFQQPEACRDILFQRIEE